MPLVELTAGRIDAGANRDFEPVIARHRDAHLGADAAAEEDAEVVREPELGSHHYRLAVVGKPGPGNVIEACLGQRTAPSLFAKKRACRSIDELQGGS